MSGESFGSDCTGRGIIMKRMMIHIRFVRVRGWGPRSPCLSSWVPENVPGWLDPLSVSVRGGMFNGNKIALKSLTGGDLDRNVRYWQLGAGIWSQGIWHPGSPRPGHWPPHKYCKQISRKKSVKKPMATEQHRGRSNQFITQYLMKIFKTDQTWV